MLKALQDCHWIPIHQENVHILQEIASFAADVLVKCHKHTCSNLIHIASPEHLEALFLCRWEHDQYYIDPARAYEVAPQNIKLMKSPCSNVFGKMVRVVCDECYSPYKDGQNWDIHFCRASPHDLDGHEAPTIDFDFNPCLQHPRCALCFKFERHICMTMCWHCNRQCCSKCCIIGDDKLLLCKDCRVVKELKDLKDAVETSIQQNVSYLAGIIAEYGRGVVVECMASKCHNEIAFDDRFEFEEEFRKAQYWDAQSWERGRLGPRAGSEMDDIPTAPIMKCYSPNTSKRSTLLLFGKKRRIFCAKCCTTGAVTSCASVYGSCSNYDEYALCASSGHKTCSLCQIQVRGWDRKSKCHQCNEFCCQGCMLGPGLDRWCATGEWLAEILFPHIGWRQEENKCVVSYTHWLPITRDDVYWLKTLPRIKITRSPRWVDERTLIADSKRKRRENERLQQQTKGRWITKKKRKRKRKHRIARNLDASTMWCIRQEHGWCLDPHRQERWCQCCDDQTGGWSCEPSYHDSVHWEMNGALMDTRWIQQYYGRI